MRFPRFANRCSLRPLHASLATDPICTSCTALERSCSLVRQFFSLSLHQVQTPYTGTQPRTYQDCRPNNLYQGLCIPCFTSFPISFPHNSLQDTTNNIATVAATSLLLSIKHTTDDGELYASHGHARGGVGVLIATGTSRGSLGRLPQAGALAKKQSQRLKSLHKLETSDANALSLGLEQAGQSRWDTMGLHQVRALTCTP